MPQVRLREPADGAITALKEGRDPPRFSRRVMPHETFHRSGRARLADAW